MGEWNNDLNPIPAEAKILLKAYKEQGQSVNNPVEDLTEMLIECYEALSTITENYKSTGIKSYDSSVHRVKPLLENWSSNEIDILRQKISLQARRPSIAPPPIPSVFEKTDSEKKLDIANNSEITTNQTDLPDPPTRNSNENASESISKSSSNSSLSSAKGVNKTNKNDEYFMKLKEDEALAKKQQEEKEAKMKPEELKKLQEERRLAEEHNNSKTEHLSKLGSRFMPGKKKTATGEVVLQRKSGGRGRGRGRGSGT